MLSHRTSDSRIVFIVDRDAVSLEGLARAFRERGWVAYPFGGCLQAVAVAASQVPGLLVIDQRLAHDGAVSLLSRLRTVNPHLRAVVTSRVPSISAAVRAIRTGFDDYVALPLAPAKLHDILVGAAPEPPPLAPPEASAAGVRKLPSLFEVEWEHIHAVLYDCRGNITRAARALGLDRRSLQRKLRRLPPTPIAAAGVQLR